jgi:hypothetical protein
MLEKLKKKKLLESLKPNLKGSADSMAEGSALEEQGETKTFENKEDPNHSDEQIKKKKKLVK